MRERRAGRLIAALAILATGLAITSSSATAQETSDLSVREVDGTEPSAVKVSFFYGEDRSDLSSLTLRENGVQVETSAPAPISEQEQQGVVLLVDVSQSMRENAALERAREGAASYVDARSANEHIAVVTFGNEVQVLQDFTTDDEALDEAVAAITLAEAGGTKLYDGLAAAAGLYERSPSLQPNVLLMSDGEDTASALELDGALSALAHVDAAVFSVALSSADFNPDELATISSRTGGQAVSTDDPTELGALFGDMHEAVGRQYSVTFESKLGSGTAAAELQLAVGESRAVAAYTPGAKTSGADAVQVAAVAEPSGPDFLRGSAGLYIGVLLVLLAASVIVYTLISVFTRDRSGLESALQPYAEGYVASSDDGGDDDESNKGLAQTQILQRAVALTGQFAEDRGVLPRIESMLEQANLPLRAAEALFFYLAAIVIGTLLMLVVTQQWVWALFALAALVLVPPAVLSYLGTRRRKQFETMLPDTLQLLSSTLRAGYSLMQGVEAVSQEVAEPMGRELRRVVTEARLGRPLELALEGVAERMASGDFAWAVMAIRIQREVGGNLSELLMTVAETMTQRERLRRNVAALTAEGKISAIVLGILPVGLMLIMYAINPEYIEVLFDRTIGNFMLGGGLLLMLVGFYWMKKTIDIDI